MKKEGAKAKGGWQHREHEAHVGLGFLVPVAIVSFSILAYEIVASRLLSVLLSYHFVFLVLSLALLGSGLGGLFLHILRPRGLLRSEELGLLMRLGAAASAAIPASGVFMVWLGGLEALGGDVLWFAPPLLIPFFLGGAFLAQVYRLLPRWSGRTYGADLIGAAAGALGGILLLELVGGVSAPLVLGVVASVGVILLVLTLEKGRSNTGAGCYPVVPLLGCLFFGLANRAGMIHLEILPVANPGKEIHEAVFEFKGKIIESRWSSFGRTDLVAYQEDSKHMDIYLDGTAGSPMYSFHGDLHDPQPWLVKLRERFPGAMPLSRLSEHERDSALIIGPGGGRDVLLALFAGIKEIEAVEVNPELVEIVREKAWFNGGLYKDFPGVKIVVEEGRSYLRRQKRHYDLIFMSLPVTNTSRSIESYSLTENYLFTVESMAEYWDHLSYEGRLVVVTHNDAELLRLLAIALEAMNGKGLKTEEAMGHLWVVSSGDYLVLVLKKTPFQPRDCFWAFKAMLEKRYTLSESFLPFLGPDKGLNPALADLASGRLKLQELVKRAAQKGYDISPVSDENPFFYKLELGMPATVKAVLYLSWGLLFLVGVIFTLWIWRTFQLSTPVGVSRPRAIEQPLRLALFFCLIGVGFILFEIYAVQRLSLVVGQPVWTTGTVLFSILLSGGAGSLWAGKSGAAFLDKRIRTICLILCGVLLAYGVSFDTLLATTGALPKGARLAAAALSVAPVGFLMGMPFPMGIRILGLGGHISPIPWMWALNGIASVAGSSLSILLAIEWGLSWALAGASLCYFLGFLVFFSHRGPRSPSQVPFHVGNPRPSGS